jgi:hypothetical protein
MTLRSAIRRTTVGLLLLTAGCTTTSSGRDTLMSRMSALRSAENDKDLPDQDEPDTRVASDRRRPDREQSERDRDPPDVRETSLAASRPASQPFDPATLMLIETELRDCPPAERQQWMDLLQSIDPASIPHALQARRLQATRSASATTGLAARQTEATFGGAGDSPFGNGHSTMSVTAGAPRLDFESLDADSAVPASNLTSRLSAPEPSANSAALAGVSPFGRSPERDAAGIPAVQTGFLTRTDARPESAAGLPQTGAAPATMPMIAPNQPGTVPVANAGSTGRVEPLGQFEIMPANGFNAAEPGAGSLSSTTLQGAYWQETLQRLTSLVEAEVAATQPGLSDAERIEFIKRQVWLRMLYLMAEQPQRAQSAIPGLNPAEQEFWTALFWAVSNYFDAQSLPDSKERAALTLQQLEYARNRLQQLASLQLRNVSFCYKINSFGNFESWARDEFRPGQTVLLYAELSNFESRPHSQGHFATRLKSDIEIRRGRADGELVESNSLPVTEDACRSIRHDYFHSYTIDLPQHLTPGPYTLILRVEDEFSGKTAVHPISFLIR